MELKDILLEKVKGEWKIVSLTIIGISSYEEDVGGATNKGDL